MSDDEPMLALTVYQPWAWLIAHGYKAIETRSWAPSERHLPRGTRIAIHAGAASNERRKRAELWPQFQCRIWYRYGGAVSTSTLNLGPDDFPFGAVVATATFDGAWETTGPTGHRAGWVEELSDVERSFGNFDLGRFGWRLRDVRLLPIPVSCRGRQRLWRLPADVERLVRDAA